MQVTNDNLFFFTDLPNKAFEWDPEPAHKAGFDQESTYCSCHMRLDALSFGLCARHSLTSLGLDVLGARESGSARQSFGEHLSHEIEQDEFDDNPAFNPALVVLKMEQQQSATDFFAPLPDIPNFEINETPSARPVEFDKDEDLDVCSSDV
jgi:hypothetical protein